MRVALVEYLNTLPFVEALQNNTNWKIIKEVPAKCIELFQNDEVELALVPVGGLANFYKNYKKITNYGIASAYNKVNSVFIFSNTNIENIHTLYLDKDSRTSNILAQLILKKLYNKNNIMVKNYIDNTISGDNYGIVSIGDKAMKEKSNYKYHYDLAELWNNWQKLPFVFAIWIINPNFYSHKLEKFLNNIFQNTITNIEKYFELWTKKHKVNFSKNEIEKYFKENIALFLTEEHKKSLEIFINLAVKEFSYAFAII